MIPPNYVVIKIGDIAESMFFIVSGQLEVELTKENKVFETGEFFGEMGILNNAPRTATIVSLTECKLLELKAEDLQHLMDTHPTIRRQVEEVNQARRKALENDYIKGDDG